jgi:DNA polymerase-3 subunit beta
MATAVTDKPEAATVDKPESAPSKATVSLSNLKHALKTVSAAIERKTTIPILTCVKVEQTPAGLILEATNLDLAIRAAVPESTTIDKPVVIPAEKLLDWTKLLTGDEVKLSLTDRRATLQCARARAVLPIMGVGSWPQISFEANGGAITLDQEGVARALRFAQIAVSKEASRYTLNGILAVGDGSHLKFVATNGHTMMIYSISCEDKLKNLLIPAGMVKALLPMLSDGGVDVTFDDQQIIAALPGETPVHVAHKKLAGPFPNWEAVVPKNNTVITAKAGELRSSLERCLLLSDERSCSVKLTFDKEITLEGSDAQSGEARETVDCQGTPKQPFSVGVNGEYLLDLFKLLSGDVRICLPDTNQSALMFSADPAEGDHLDYVVMPMRLEK